MAACYSAPHHYTNADQAGQAPPRGPLTAFADILIEMETPPGDRFSRRRNLYGVGRYPGTLQQVSAELNAEGTDYVVLESGLSQSDSGPLLESLQRVLSQSTSPLTRQQILARWPRPRRRREPIRSGEP